VDNLLPIVAHPDFTRAVLRLSLARRKEVYIALRAVERGDEQLLHDQANIYHLDLTWESGQPLRLLLARGIKRGREVALATTAYWVEPGAETSAARIKGAMQVWDAWVP
jgi:hypothetical protein